MSVAKPWMSGVAGAADVPLARRVARLPVLAGDLVVGREAGDGLGLGDLCARPQGGKQEDAGGGQPAGAQRTHTPHSGSFPQGSAVDFPSHATTVGLLLPPVVGRKDDLLIRLSDDPLAIPIAPWPPAQRSTWSAKSPSRAKNQAALEHPWVPGALRPSSRVPKTGRDPDRARGLEAEIPGHRLRPKGELTVSPSPRWRRGAAGAWEAAAPRERHLRRGAADLRRPASRARRAPIGHSGRNDPDSTEAAQPSEDDEERPLAALRLTGATGLEPAASGVTGRRSNQLSYAPGALQ